MLIRIKVSKFDADPDPKHCFKTILFFHITGMYVVKMRGLPFRATEQDICEWFSSVCDPIDVFIRFNQEGRPSGEAEVTFATEGEAKRALSKNKQNMQNRYIELFLEQY